MGLRILLVEDDDLLQSTLKRQLRRRGHTVTAVASLQKGREALSANPNVLVLDRQVVGGTGWDLRHEAPPDCKIVLMTASAPPDSPPHWVKAVMRLEELYDLIEGK